jgi:hypothetical protein
MHGQDYLTYAVLQVMGKRRATTSSKTVIDPEPYTSSRARALNHCQV